MNDPDIYDVWIDKAHRNDTHHESSSSMYIEMAIRFYQASFITQLFDMVLSAIVFVFGIFAVWALRKNRRLAFFAGIIGAVHALGRMLYFAIAPVDASKAVDVILTASTVLEFAFMGFWTVILVMFGTNLDMTASQRSAVRPLHPQQYSSTTESVPNVREQRKKGDFSDGGHTSGYVPSHPPKPSDEYLLNPITPPLDVPSSNSARQNDIESNRSVIRGCFDALRIDGISRLRFSACFLCASLTVISFVTSIVWIIADYLDESKSPRVTSATLALCIVRGFLWTFLEFCYLTLSVRVLGKSREGLLFASNRKSPLRATCAAMLVMTLKAVVTPWDYMFAPIGVIVSGLDVEYCTLAWYLLLIFDELIPLAYMLFVLSRVTISSIKKSRRNRILFNQDSYGSINNDSSMDSFGTLTSTLISPTSSMTSLSPTSSSSLVPSIPTSLSSSSDRDIIIPTAISVPKKIIQNPVDYSQGALLMNANLSLTDAKPVSDDCYAASLDSMIRLSSSLLQNNSDH